MKEGVILTDYASNRIVSQLLTLYLLIKKRTYQVT